MRYERNANHGRKYSCGAQIQISSQSLCDNWKRRYWNKKCVLILKFGHPKSMLWKHLESCHDVGFIAFKLNKIITNKTFKCFWFVPGNVLIKVEFGGVTSFR